MFERFTDNARAVMQIADRQAQQLNHPYIGTQYILLAIAEHGTGVAATVLTSLGIDVPQIPSIVCSIFEQGSDRESIGRLPQTPRAKRVIEFAMEEARSSNHRYVGTEHLLVGMLRTDGVAAQALADMRVDLETFRNKVLQVLDTPEYRDRNDAFARQANNVGCVSAGIAAVVLFLGVLTIGIIIGIWL